MLTKSCCNKQTSKSYSAGSHVDVNADIDFVNTTVALSGTAHYDYSDKLFSDKYKFIQKRGSFWVWLVQFEWSLEVGAKLDVDLEAKASATIAYEGSMNGSLDIKWKCVNADCTHLKPDHIDIDFIAKDELLYALEVDIKLTVTVTALTKSSTQLLSIGTLSFMHTGMLVWAIQRVQLFKFTLVWWAGKISIQRIPTLMAPLKS
jgi:hypothetical protein